MNRSIVIISSLILLQFPTFALGNSSNSSRKVASDNSYCVDNGSGIVVKFTSNAPDQIATLADYNPNDYNYMFTGGYPKLGDKSPWRFTVGQIFEKEQGLLNATVSDFQSNSSDKLQSASSLTGGYELVYTSITYGGMSGGPVLDSVGRVIGIHGRAEGEQALDNKTGDSGSSGGKVQLGYSLGIPVSTFLGLATRLGVKPQYVENTPPSQLNAEHANSIKKAVLSADISFGNATATQWLERGNQLWRLRQYEQAVQAFDQAIKLKPSFMYLAYYGKGLALAYKGKYLEAQVALEQAVKLKPDYAAAWYTQSVNYENLNQLDKALVAIDKAIQYEPKNPNSYNEKRFILRGLKRYSEAEAAINEAINLSTRSVFYVARGLIYADMQKWDLALADYNKDIQLNPQDAKAYYNRGNLYGNQKKWDLALADFNKVIQLNPQSAKAYNNRGLIYSDKQKWDLALADYNQAIEINPNYALAYFGRGLVHDKKGDKPRAIQDLQQAAQLFHAQSNSAGYKQAINFLKQLQQ